MINLKIYGKPSSFYGYMKDVLDKTANKANIELSIEEITDTEAFIDKKIMSIPAYQINGQIEQRGSQSINDFLRDMQIALLRQANYGSMKKIFVPIDFSEVSDNLISYSINLSKYFNAIVKLVNVFHPQPIAEEAGVIIPEDPRDRLERLIKLTDDWNQNWIGNLSQTPIDFELLTGFAFNEIKQLSIDNPDDLIVIGSSDTSKTMKKIFGSVSTAVAKDCRSNLLIVPPHVSFEFIEKIAFCSSDVKKDKLALKNLCEFAKAFDAEINILHYKEEREYNGSEIMKEIEQYYPVDNIKYEELEGDNLVDAVNFYCATNSVQILAMPRIERNIFEALFHKSFTKQMTITSEIPLLILRK